MGYIIVEQIMFRKEYKMKKRNLILLVIGALILSSLSFTASDVEYVDAYRATDMNFEVDGQPWQPRDVDGSLLYPIVVNGRSYVPVRSLLEAKGVTVDWRDPTRTIVLDYSTIELDQPEAVVPLYKKKEIVVVGSQETEATMVYTDLPKLTKPVDKATPLLMETTYDGPWEGAGDIIILVNGKESELTPKTIMASDELLSPDNVKLYLDEAGQVFMMDILDEDSDGDGLESRIGIEIEISGPPWKIKIRIKF
jgi:hypothetical protein